MDLTALNATPIGAAARAVGRMTYGAVNGVSGTLSGIRFQARTSWQLLMNRTRFDYRAEVGDPATNSIVGAVVGWIARNFPEAPVRIVKEGTTEIAYMPSATGPGAMLRLLERPNPYYSGVLQWMATIVDWIVDGNAYWIKVRNGVGRVEQLWWVPSRMMTPDWDLRRPNVFISRYIYTVDGIKYAVKPKDVVHFRNGLDPSNPRKGLSKLNSLLREIFTDDEAANFTASLVRNLGVPGVIIAPANTTAAMGGAFKSDPEAIKTTFMDKFGGDKRGEPMVLTAPTEIKVLSWSPEQMNLTALRRIPEERVSAVLGVPAGVANLGAGLDRNTFNNLAEGNVSAYTQGVIPDQRLIAAELTMQLLPDFANIEREAISVWFDWTQVQAMAGAMAALWKSHEGAATKGLIKRSTFKLAVGMPVGPEDEVYILPNNYAMIPVGGGGNPPSSGARNGNGAFGRIEGSRAATAEWIETLLLAGGPDDPRGISGTGTAGEIRCSGCNRLLAEMAAPPYRFTCRCHVVTSSEAAA